MEFLLLLGALAGLLIATALCRLYIWLPLGIVSVLIVIAWEVPNPPTLFYVAGTRVTVVDALCATMGAMTVSTLLEKRKVNGGTGRAQTYQIGLTLLSIAVGAATFGVGSAVNEARIVLLPLILIAWSATVCREKKYQAIFMKWILITAWCLVVVAVYHAISHGIGDADSATTLASGDFQTGRILVSGQAIFVALAILISGYQWARQRNVAALLSMSVFTVVVLLSQHRTVWTAALVALSLIWVLSNRAVKEKAIVAAVSIFAILLLLKASGFAAGLFELVGQSISSGKTLVEREDSWDVLFAQYTNSSARTILFGFPFGTGFERIDSNGVTVRFQPHNWYLTLLLRIGALGLLAWVAMIATGLLRAVQRSDTMVVGVLAMISVYGWAYGINWYLGLCLGLAIAISNASKDESASRSTVLPDGSYVSQHHEGRRIMNL